jgi:hypothetical protein
VALIARIRRALGIRRKPIVCYEGTFYLNNQPITAYARVELDPETGVVNVLTCARPPAPDPVPTSPPLARLTLELELEA